TTKVAPLIVRSIRKWAFMASMSAPTSRMPSPLGCEGLNASGSPALFAHRDRNRSRLARCHRHSNGPSPTALGALGAILADLRDDEGEAYGAVRVHVHTLAPCKGNPAVWQRVGQIVANIGEVSGEVDMGDIRAAVEVVMRARWRQRALRRPRGFA